MNLFNIFSGIVRVCKEQSGLKRLLRYDPRTSYCRDGIVFNFTTQVQQAPGASPSPSVSPNTTLKIATISTTTLLRQDLHVLECGGELLNLSNFKTKHECCGYEIFRPDFETCCQQSRSKVKVFKNAPAKTHL